MLVKYRRGMGAAESHGDRSASASDHSAVRAIRSRRKQFQSLKGTHELPAEVTAIFCGPCERMEPVLVELDVAKTYRLQSVQMVMVFKDGKQVDELVGADKGELERKIEKHRA